MILKDDTVLLRDFKREDIAKRIEWETEKTEWQLWDGPWEYEGLTEKQGALAGDRSDAILRQQRHNTKQR